MGWFPTRDPKNSNNSESTLKIENIFFKGDPKTYDGDNMCIYNHNDIIVIEDDSKLTANSQQIISL